MQSNNPLALPFPLSPLVLLNAGDLSEGGFEVSRFLFLGSLLFSREGGGMDLSKVGEKILSSVRSARSLGLLPSPSDRPEVPARAAAAAAVARIIAGLPPHQRHNLSSSSEELSSIYGSRPQGQVVDELEEEFYEEEFDPVRHVLEHIPTEESELSYFEEKATLKLAQLDMIAERLSRHVMENYEEMVKGMNLVRELEKDLKVANVICMNGRRHLTSSRNEVSRDLIVTTSSKKKQALLDLLPILTELRHALDMQMALETSVEDGNFSKAFQVLAEYLQLLDSLSELSAVQEMNRSVEVWLGKTLQKLDSLLLGVCQDFKEEDYITVVDAYALIGDVSGLAEKIQSFFMQEVLSETHSVLRTILQEDLENPNMQSNRLTYSDLCIQIPESKFRQCLLATLAMIFKLMSSYYAIMNFQPEVSACHSPDRRQKQGTKSGVSGDAIREDSCNSLAEDSSISAGTERVSLLSSVEEPPTTSASCTKITGSNGSVLSDYQTDEARDDGTAASSSGSPWFELRKDAATFVSQTLQRGRKNLWQLTTSRIAVLLSSSAVSSSSIHQFLRNYEDLSIFILAGEAFCGIEAVEFRQKLKSICGSYFIAFHRQSINALKMVMEKENWQIMPPDTIQVVSFAGLVGDGAALIASSNNSPKSQLLQSNRSVGPVENRSKRSGFLHWLERGNPFSSKLNGGTKENFDSFQLNGSTMHGESGNTDEISQNSKSTQKSSAGNHVNGSASLSEDENEDLHADFIDEDSQLPSRISKPNHLRHHSSRWNDEGMRAQTGSSLSLLKLMDKYARLMQKLEIVNIEFFKGICQLFEIFFHFVYGTFGQQNTHPSGKASPDLPSLQAKDCIIKNYTRVPPSHLNSPSFGLKERCAGADTISLVAQLLHRSKAHLQSMLLQNSGAIVEDFYVHLVDAVPELTEHIHRTTARLLLHINAYVDRIANSKWEVRELGLEHNGYVDLLLGEFKHYKTRLAHGGIREEVQDLLLEYGLENVAETLIEGLSRVRRCTDEGRALMSLDLQVLINGLKHFVSIDVKPKLQMVEAFIKAYYLPETEYVHWARDHPEYSKNQIVGLINLVATMKGWKRKTRLEVLEKIESILS
ncbi:Vacuolar protein sorting-associated protein [Abeliophyllum distichum]|uniref:Vacuolar protein sorting-associated protein n=1 Tax=Abeliophyllum distichum TaxID=126358 RepID=A0ABD1VUM9_9LAMI